MPGPTSRGAEPMPRLSLILAVTVAASLTLSACKTLPLAELSSFGDSSASMHDMSALAYYPDDQLIAEGRAQFREGNFGRSYALFKKSVEVFPQDTTAWLGLAASADKVRRFDTADIAYRRLGTMIPGQLEYYNNVAYSYLLRGNIQMAQRYFLEAQRMAPDNEIVRNNLQLLRSSVAFSRG